MYPAAIDYSNGTNLASTVIRPGLRVSTASFPDSAGHEDSLIETFIFRYGENSGRSTQVFHKTREEALKVHNYIVANLKQAEPFS